MILKDRKSTRLNSSHNLLEQILLKTCATCEHFDGPKTDPFICLGLGEKKAQRHIHESQENQIEILKS